MIMNPKYKILEKALGLIFIASAIVNGLGAGENLPLMFSQAAQSLGNTRLAYIANFISTHHMSAIIATCLLMAVTGALELFHHRLASVAGLLQITMMLGFITFFHRAFPEIIFVDAILILALAIMLIHRTQMENRNEKT